VNVGSARWCLQARWLPRDLANVVKVGSVRSTSRPMRAGGVVNVRSGSMRGLRLDGDADLVNVGRSLRAMRT